MNRHFLQLARRRRGSSSCIEPHAWPEQRGGTRVLVENPHEDYRSEHAQVLRDAGYEVATCSGPSETHGCPLVEAGPCSLVEGADVVVSTTQLPDRLQILGRLTARERPVVVVEGTALHLSRDGDVLGNAQRLPFPVSSGELLGAVAAATEAPAD